jgi:hypothetical protein
MSSSDTSVGTNDLQNNRVASVLSTEGFGCAIAESTNMTLYEYIRIYMYISISSHANIEMILSKDVDTYKYIHIYIYMYIQVYIHTMHPTVVGAHVKLFFLTRPFKKLIFKHHFL